jgi:hypothetical protein
MTSIFDNATFGTLFKTRDGYPAVYLAHIAFNDTHKLLVQGFEYPFIYTPDGKRKGGGGRYASRYGCDLDLVSKFI